MLSDLLDKNGFKLIVDEENNTLRLETPGGCALCLAGGALSLNDAHGNRLLLDDKGITLESKKGIGLKCAGEVAVQTQHNISLKAATTFEAEGLSASIHAAHMLKISADALTELKGGLIKIN